MYGERREPRDIRDFDRREPRDARDFDRREPRDFDRGRRMKSRFFPEPKIALFVDGPNMLRKEFMIDLRELSKRMKKYGRVVVSKVFLNQFAPEKLIEAIINEGFESEMILAEEEAEKNDVDVAMAVAAMEAATTNDSIDIIAIASRDADFLPVVQKIKEYGKIAIVVGAEPGFSSGLQNAADYVENL